MGRFALVLAVALAAETALVGQQAPGSVSRALPLGLIAGRVVTADTGAPVRGAQVRLTPIGGGEPRLATTGDDGRFEVRDLFTGQWNVTASKSGFLTQRFGQRRPSDTRTPITLAAGQRATVTFALVRAGAISGRLYDEFGEPLVSAHVEVLRSRVVRGTRQLDPIGTFDVTDDTGAFRLHSLAPGDYYVGASMRASDDPRTDATIGAPTYYPGTPALTEAQRITLAAGEEQSNVNFQLLPVRAVRVSGFVMRASGAPAAGVAVHLGSAADSRRTVGSPVGNFGRTGADGSFTIVNVPPGSYILTAFEEGGGGGDFEEAMAPIAVATGDVTGITVAMSRGTVLTGTVVAEQGTVLPASLAIEIHALSRGRSKGPFSGVPISASKRTFQIPGLRGIVSFEVDGLPDSLTVRTIEVNGTDVTDTPVEFGGQAASARIVLTNRVSEVVGVVTASGQPVADASVVIFPDDVVKWKYPSRYVKAARTDAQGRFAIRKLPPDQRYLAVALENLEDGEFEDPEFLERMRGRAVDMVLQDGERKALSLTLARFTN